VTVGDGGSGPGSSGCGAAALPQPASIPDGGGFGATLPIQRFNLDVSGTAREFILGLPPNYDANHKYPVVFAWHGRGGTDVQVAWGGSFANDLFGGYYGLRYLSNQANKPMIFVAGQGLDPNDAGAGWPNTGGQDVAFTQAMVAWLESNFCVDTAHIYSVGMSYGGIMSNTVGCAMGDVFRAIAPMSGSGPGYGFGSPQCKGQVAAWLAHGSQDTTVPTANGQASRDYWAKANHCTSTTMPITPSPCVAYQGCDPGYPVDWCEFDGGHTVVSFEPPGIWAFLQQF
jgi:poly(3-hydroxybutyrate) depolymerase